MPRLQQLPEPLSTLSRRQAVEITDTRFHQDVDRLIEAVEKAIETRNAGPATAQHAAAPPVPPITPGSYSPLVTGTALPEPVDSFTPASSQATNIGASAPSQKVDNASASRSTNEVASAPQVSAAAREFPESQSRRNIRKRFILGAGIPLGLLILVTVYVTKEPGQSYRGDRPALSTTDLVDWNKKGEAYLLGQGVTKDYAEALNWFRKAAEAGYAPAQDNLGVMLANGWGAITLAPVSLTKRWM